MTTTIAFATGDGHIESSSTSYATAQNGSSLVVNTTNPYVRVGQHKVGSNISLYEGFFAIPYTVPSNEIVVSADVSLFSDTVVGTGTARDLGIRSVAWGTLDSADWKTVSQINALSRIGFAGGVHTATDKYVYLAEDTLNEQIAASGTLQFVAYSSRFLSSSAPAAGEYNEFSSVEASGTSNDPALVFSSIMTHTLVRLAGCHVQLSDGRHVFIEANTGGASPTLTLKYQDPPSAAVNIATNLLDVSRDMGSSNAAMQSYTLVRDASDNLYWIGHAAFGGNTLNIVCWKKTGGSTWAEQGEKQAAMPANSGVINNLAAAWHNVGTNGTIMVVGSHEANSTGPAPARQVFYALLSCNYLLNGSGSLLRASGDANDVGLVSTSSRSVDHNNQINETGSVLDVAALTGSNDRGVVVCHHRGAILGEYAPIGVCRYVLNSTGTGISYAHRDEGGAWSTKDSNAKVRVLPISDTRFVVVTVDKDSGWGPTIRVLQNIGSSSTFVELANILLGDEGIASLPSPSSLHMSGAWDALYHPAANTVEFWYFDTANSLRLMRTSVNLTTYKAVRNEIQVQATVGAGGSTNHAIRVQRGAATESEANVAVANRSSGGAQSTIYVRDQLNVAPLAPTLVDKTNYDATVGALFDWTFNDQNVGDTQTAYEFQIDNADTLASVVSTGKITSSVSERNVTGGTLTNGVNYRWRVRTYDTSDAVGAWSAYDFFTTSAGGSVNITNPATDNPAGYIVDDVTVQWSASGITQAAYRIWLKNNVTGATISDTNWITSTATSHQLTGLLSDVEYRIEVQLRNAALVTSNIATRLLTPDFNEPEIPLITVTPVPAGGYTLIDVVNPTPTGDRPEADTNRVQRRKSSESEWITVAEVGNGGSYLDFNVTSGVTYLYRVVGVGSIGSSTSVEIEAILDLMGVWMHLPTDPAGTAINLLYGKDQRGDTITSYAELTHYAGRTDPVADFAHYEDRTFNVVVDIPYGEDYHEQLDALDAMITSKQTIVYRDNRRRHAFGTILGGLGKTDTAVGTQATFDFTKVSYNEEVV